MNILVTGSSGLVGAALVARLTASGHRVLPLRRGTVGSASEAAWNPETGQVHFPASIPFEAVVHLAGETIAQRWTPAAKARIRASRVDATRLLCEALVKLPQPPRVLVCASATGYYGDAAMKFWANRAVQERAFLRRSARPGSRLPGRPGEVACAWCTCGWALCWPATAGMDTNAGMADGDRFF